jgi:toxin FitB
MTTYLLDTNVVSMLGARRHQQAPALIAWLDRNGTKVFLSVTTIAEMESGALKLRREGKTERADQIAGLVSAIITDFGDRILPMDVDTARLLARLGAETYQQPVALADLIIAATASRHGLVVLTRNMKDFARLSVKSLDPFTNLPSDV